MMETSAHSGSSGGVMFCQEAPPSREMWTSPSSEPAQKTPGSWGDSRKAKIVRYSSTPLLSCVIGAADGPCGCGSLRVRSGVMTYQVVHSSVERWTWFEQIYSTSGSCCETSTGKVHWKR